MHIENTIVSAIAHCIQTQCDYNALLFFITGYRQCPVRLQLSNATPVSITLSTTRTEGQYPTSAANKSNPSCHSLRQGHC